MLDIAYIRFILNKIKTSTDESHEMSYIKLIHNVLSIGYDRIDSIYRFKIDGIEYIVHKEVVYKELKYYLKEVQ